MDGEFKVFVGFVEGKPYMETCLDDYGEYAGLQLFRRMSDAKKRFEDVRTCTLKIPKTRKKATP